MNIRKLLVEALVGSCFALLFAGHSQAGPVGNGGQQSVYIRTLKAELAQDRSSQSGPSRRAEKVEKNASALTGALIRELNNRGVKAYPLGDQDSVPQAGLLISGVFTQNVPAGLLFSGLRSLGSSTPNTEVDISVASLGSDRGKAARLINTSASLGGQGSAVSLNPYEAAAKLVVHHVAADRSIEDLARRMADQILSQSAPAESSKG